MKSCRKMCEAYKAYFGMPIRDQDKSLAPHLTCEHCKKTIEGEVNVAAHSDCRLFFRISENKI